MNDKVLPNNLIENNSEEPLLKFPKDFYSEAKNYLNKEEILKQLKLRQIFLLKYLMQNN